MIMTAYQIRFLTDPGDRKRIRFNMRCTQGSKLETFILFFSLVNEILVDNFYTFCILFHFQITKQFSFYHSFIIGRLSLSIRP